MKWNYIFMQIYTLGHSNYTMERLIEMLRHFNINCVVDIRGTPYSKYNVQFDKAAIKESLTKAGFIYIYMAKELAAKRENKTSYNKEGYAEFNKVIEEEEFKRGIERLKIGCKKGYRIVLLGAMQEPIRCHRAILVGRALREAGFEVKHILDDYSLASQEQIEVHLLDKYFSDRGQIRLDLSGNEMSETDMIEEGYKKANKEIGYRIEGLKPKKKK